MFRFKKTKPNETKPTTEKESSRPGRAARVELEQRVCQAAGDRRGDRDPPVHLVFGVAGHMPGAGPVLPEAVAERPVRGRGRILRDRAFG